MLPNASDFINLWQTLSVENGLKGIHFIAHEQDLTDTNKLLDVYERDKILGFNAINVVNKFPIGKQIPLKYRLAKKILHKNPKFRIIPHILPYLSEVYSTELDRHEDVYPSVLPGWDHTPRTGISGRVILNSTPEKFQEVCTRAIENVKNKSEEKRFIFIKSWNEWAEGNYMEPDMKYGKAYLDALKHALNS